MMKVLHFLTEAAPSAADSLQAAKARDNGDEYIFVNAEWAKTGDVMECDCAVNVSKDLAKYKGTKAYQPPVEKPMPDDTHDAAADE